MTILKLLVGPNRVTLSETGEGYEQVRRFSSVEEMNQYLNELGLQAWQLNDLRAGKVVGIDSEQSWPNRGGQGPSGPSHP